MRAKISPCISSCRVVRGASPGEILKTKNAGEAIRSFCNAIKVSNLPELRLFADISEEKIPIYSMLFKCL